MDIELDLLDLDLHMECGSRTRRVRIRRKIYVIKSWVAWSFSWGLETSIGCLGFFLLQINLCTFFSK